MIPLVPTLDDCARLEQLLASRFSCVIVDKEDSPVARTIARVLELLGVMRADAFAGYATTLPLLRLGAVAELALKLEEDCAGCSSAVEDLFAAAAELAGDKRGHSLIMIPRAWAPPSRHDVAVHEGTHGGVQIIGEIAVAAGAVPGDPIERVLELAAGANDLQIDVGCIAFSGSYLGSEWERAARWEGPAYGTAVELAIARGVTPPTATDLAQHLASYQCSTDAIKAAARVIESVERSARKGSFSPVVEALMVAA
jgi:hypothetical protein